jgi:hypothetical protein
VNGQPAPGLLDLRKQDQAASAPGGPAPDTGAVAGGAAHPQSGSAEQSRPPADPARDDWQTP